MAGMGGPKLSKLHVWSLPRPVRDGTRGGAAHAEAYLLPYGADRRHLHRAGLGAGRRGLLGIQYGAAAACLSTDRRVESVASHRCLAYEEVRRSRDWMSRDCASAGGR